MNPLNTTTGAALMARPLHLPNFVVDTVLTLTSSAVGSGIMITMPQSQNGLGALLFLYGCPL